MCEPYAVSDVVAVKEKQEGLAIEERSIKIVGAFRMVRPEHVAKVEEVQEGERLKGLLCPDYLISLIAWTG